MARLMTRADGSPIHAHDGRPMYIEDICRPVEMVGTQCGHTYHLRGPVRLASSKDPTREDVVDEANRIARAATQRRPAGYGSLRKKCLLPYNVTLEQR